MIQHPLVLEGRILRLEPLQEVHIEPLMAIARATPEVFQYTSTPVTDAQCDVYFEKAFSTRERGSAYPFVMLEQPSGNVIGTTRYADIMWGYRNCELGYTWISPEAQGTGANVESKYLMLRYAFETLQFVRVYLHTDTRNKHSQRAIKRLGAVYEGILRNHMIVKNGYIRDTMIFSIIQDEWPEVKRKLGLRLDAKLMQQAD